MISPLANDTAKYCYKFVKKYTTTAVKKLPNYKSEWSHLDLKQSAFFFLSFASASTQLQVHSSAHTCKGYTCVCVVEVIVKLV